MNDEFRAADKNFNNGWWLVIYYFQHELDDDGIQIDDDFSNEMMVKVMKLMKVMIINWITIIVLYCT